MVKKVSLEEKLGGLKWRRLPVNSSAMKHSGGFISLEVCDDGPVDLPMMTGEELLALDDAEQLAKQKKRDAALKEKTSPSTKKKNNKKATAAEEKKSAAAGNKKRKERASATDDEGEEEGGEATSRANKKTRDRRLRRKKAGEMKRQQEEEAAAAAEEKKGKKKNKKAKKNDDNDVAAAPEEAPKKSKKKDTKKKKGSKKVAPEDEEEEEFDEEAMLAAAAAGGDEDIDESEWAHFAQMQGGLDGFVGDEDDDDHIMEEDDGGGKKKNKKNKKKNNKKNKKAKEEEEEDQQMEDFNPEFEEGMEGEEEYMPEDEELINLGGDVTNAAPVESAPIPPEFDVKPCSEFAKWGNTCQVMLHKTIVEGLVSCNLKEPLPIQNASLVAALRDRMDVFGAAETGSGKTLAFGLPILQRISEQGANPERRGPLALILEPTRELAIQACDMITAVSKSTGIRTTSLIGGLSLQKQQRMISYKPHIVVATPGRLYELMVSAADPFLNSLNELLFFVIDEADRMLVDGHFKELSSIIDSLPHQQARGRKGFKSQAKKDEESKPKEKSSNDKSWADLRYQKSAKKRRKEEDKMRKVNLAPRLDDIDQTAFEDVGIELNESDNTVRRQTLVFSATLISITEERGKGIKGRIRGGGVWRPPNANEKEESVERLMWKLQLPCAPRLIDLTENQTLPPNLTQKKISCSIDGKDDVLYNFLVRRPGRTLIFVNHIALVKKLTLLLQILKIPVKPLHASMQQKQRLKSMEFFRNNKNSVLVSSDVAARGVDIPLVQFVIHYHVPIQPAVYVHRSGRTARAGTEGMSLVLLAPEEMGSFKRIMTSLKRDDLPMLDDDSGKQHQDVIDRVRLAHRLQKLILQEDREISEKKWHDRNASELEINDDSEKLDDDSRAFISLEKRKLKGEMGAIRAELDMMLKKPLVAHREMSAYVEHALLGLPEMKRMSVKRDMMLNAAPKQQKGATRYRKRR